MTRKHEINNNGTANVKTAMWTGNIPKLSAQKTTGQSRLDHGSSRDEETRPRTPMNRDEGAAREQQGAVSTCQSPTGDAASVGTSGML